MIEISREKCKALCRPWRNSIIVKLLGKRIGLNMLRTRLSRLWQPSGMMEVIDLDFEYFIVRFANRDDYSHVFSGGPWVIISDYLVVQNWRPEFIPSEGQIDRVAV